ncbi:bile acid:sodium symporter family protein [uncultured Shimia sp.]|uniref:bile acid:sodium symporter family protein n=1 Tax=uncultured Shimia sp. TaxID=573152 RepID=UPI00261668FA|nr:bile acid:sodium symporter family protein [uncultured Shimia sp.]
MLIDVALPLSLAFIMFSLGFGLTFADFGRVLAMPRAALTGMVLQIIAVPAVAFLLLRLVSLPPALAFGVMILAFCPGGVTSNILTKLAGGTVALSITLTAVVSLLSVLTVPILIDWAAGVFLGEAAVEINVTGIAVSMFAITAVPVLIGLLLRFVARDFADRTENTVSTVALVLFVVIVIAALATNWQLFLDNIGHLGPLLVGMNALLLILGVLIARVVGLSGGDGLCISVEMGVQNAALGITVAGLVAQSGGIPEFAVPAALYGITMYIVTIPGMFVLRRIFGKT